VLCTAILGYLFNESASLARLDLLQSSTPFVCGSTHSAGVLSQTVTLTGIALIDNNGVRRADAFVGSGRLLANLTTSTDGTSTESTVCGPLDTVTSFFLCNRLGYISTLSTQGSVSGIDNEDITGTPVAIRNLDCNGATTLEACQFEVLSAPDPECTHSQDATLECRKYS